MKDAQVKVERVESDSQLIASVIYKDGTYLDNNPTWHVEDSPWKALQIQTMLLRNGLSPETICEVGCGAGEILKQLSVRMPSVDLVGYEVSPQAFKLCERRATNKLNFQFKNIIDEDAYFDCLLCIDVFEHVEDYIGFIKALQSKANYKIFHIPLDISVLSVLRGWLMAARNDVGHLHYFTPETALATLKYCGYEIIDSFYTTAFNDLPCKTIKEKILRVPRKILYAISPDLMVRLLGGCSILVLAK